MDEKAEMMPDAAVVVYADAGERCSDKGRGRVVLRMVETEIPGRRRDGRHVVVVVDSGGWKGPPWECCNDAGCGAVVPWEDVRTGAQMVDLDVVRRVVDGRLTDGGQRNELWCCGPDVVVWW